MSLVFPQLFVGGTALLRNHKWMKERGVQWVLRFDDPSSPEMADDDQADSKVDYSDCNTLSFDHVKNAAQAALLQVLPQATAFVLMALNAVQGAPKQSVLVCSPRGTSRGPAVIAAMLIFARDLTAEAALSLLYESHKQTAVCIPFQSQLKAFEQIIKTEDQKKAFYGQMAQHVQALSAQIEQRQAAKRGAAGSELKE